MSGAPLLPLLQQHRDGNSMIDDGRWYVAECLLELEAQVQPKGN